MTMVTLSDVTKIVTKGTTPTTLGMAFQENGIPFIRVNNIHDKLLNFKDDVLYIDEQTHEKLSRSVIKPKDVLISIAGSIGRSCVVPDDAPDLNCNQAVCIIRCDFEKILPEYLSYWLGGEIARSQITNSKVTGVIQNLSLTQVKALKVDLPPLAEQRRIASILDQADELRQKRQQAIEKLDQLLQAAFIDMFGDPVSNPKGWEKVKFEDEVEFLTGFAFKSADFKDSGIKLCRGINILPNTLDWNDTAYWNEKELEKYSRFKILQNDILVAMDRPWISTGFKITLVKENDPNMLLVQRVARLRVKESFGANFLFQILSMPEFKKHCRITETTVPHISPTDFKSFDLIKPANHMIEKFEKIANLINIQKDKMRDSEVQNDNLFASLQNQAFSGTL
ncbi:restriction endonuclease subunit S [Acinetobacter sp. YH12043]|uniref:restriction endonuclease subunit S n=1 Tax=Acinetobacter sp. YH12043 TaxID=2601050 RepID=UPI0015D17C21|nr:restriction endonuclease subunit S [Acinetobacter sp. YH12043]